MWRRQLGQLLGLLALLCLTGCMVANTWVPRLSGSIVDSTGKPVGGARVLVVPIDSSNSDLAFELTADQKGRFHRREKVQWGLLLPVPADGIAPEFVATASHEGRQSRPEKFGGGLGQGRLFGLGKADSIDLGDLMIEDGMR